MASGLGGEALIGDEILAADAARQRRPLLLLVEQREDDPAAVLALVMVGDRVQRMLARPPLLEFGAAQFGLRQHRGGPDAVGHQVGGDMRALAGALALVQRGDDRAVKRHRAGVVAHAGDRAGRRGVLIGAHQVHQAGAGPIGVAVEAGLVGLLALFAVAGERGIDQALVERSQLSEGQCEALAHRRREIGDEDVGLGHQAMQHRLAFRPGEVERQALLVAGLQHPRVIVLAGGVSRQVRQVPVGIAEARRLDLDHVGAEIRQHGGSRRRRDETRAVQNLEAVKNAFFHSAAAPVILVGFVRVLELCVRTGRPFDPCWVADATGFLTLPWRGRVARIVRMPRSAWGASLNFGTARRMRLRHLTPPHRCDARRPSPLRG